MGEQERQICRMFAGLGWNGSLRVNDRPFHSQVDQRVAHWERALDDPGVSALRETLRESSGVPELEAVDMAKGAGAAQVQRAAQLFHRDGFVALTGVLSGAALERTASGVAAVTKTIVELDPDGLGTNGAHRYSFGGCSVTRHMLHEPAWRGLVDLSAVTAVLTEVFGSPNYLCRGGGGELALPGAVEYQALHSDQHDEKGPRPQAAAGDGDGLEEAPPLEGPDNLMHGSERLNSRGGSFRDPRAASSAAADGLTIRDLPCSMIAVNFTLTPQTFENAPIRCGGKPEFFSPFLDLVLSLSWQIVVVLHPNRNSTPKAPFFSAQRHPRLVLLEAAGDPPAGGGARLDAVEHAMPAAGWLGSPT